ncbi:three-Cys-motif partner protein TcmP [Oceaniglobus trochenteri]|uniref:three-Cys-motif partner protein TcmP n=1 Tax=Oceaniglobus trochenteri TaxID=2763260 RepID=UPI001CFF7B62|nr:three-Cys-motif partner protein TcmP [Oceaniglobus trochenteri]
MKNHYFNREQSEAKHDILRRYLVPFANKILSKWHSIDYIDGFSGPWRNVDTERLSDTSIGVSLQTLHEVAEKRGHTRQDRRIRCIFNEADPASYGLLQSFVKSADVDFPLIKVVTFNGRFAENAKSIRSAADHTFQLLFVDPTGYSGFPPSSLEHFKGRSSEVIVNFMRSFIERFVASGHRDRDQKLIELLGQKRAQYLLDTGLSIETVEGEYLRMLRGDLGYKFSGYSPIHNPDRNEIHFNLAYATNHFEGMEVMRGAEFGALSSHDRKRFEKSVRNDGPSLFDAFNDEMEIRGPYLTARQNHREQASKILRDLVIQHPRGIAFGEFAATAQQSLFLKRAELGDVIVELAKQRVIQATWQERGGQKPVTNDLILPYG